MKIGRARLIAVGLGFTILLGSSAGVHLLAQQDLDATPDLLVGRWVGEQRVRAPQLMSRFKVTLEIVGTPALHGLFTHESGRSWQTPIEIRESKVIMLFDQEKREFTLKRGNDGRLLLEAGYTRFRPYPTSNEVQLRKEK